MAGNRCNVQIPQMEQQEQEQQQNDNDSDINGCDNQPISMRKLFIGGLNLNTTESTLKAYFEQYGAIVEVVIKKNTNKQSRGFGFVTYSRSFMAKRAEDAGIHKIDGHYVPLKLTAVPNLKIIFVDYLKYKHNEEALKGYFSIFGSVKAVNIITEEISGEKQRRFAFVEFDHYDPVYKVLMVRTHTIKGMPVRVKKALSNGPKGSRQVFGQNVNNCYDDENQGFSVGYNNVQNTGYAGMFGGNRS